MIRAADSGSVILTGNSTLFLTGKHIVLEGLSFEACILDESCIVLDGATDCRITDCRFSHSGGNRAAISIQGSSARNTVEHSEFAHLGQRSVQVVIRSEEAPVENRIIENCFRDIPPIPSGNGRETIQIGQNQREWGHIEPKTFVERNRFLRCDGEIEIISNKSSRNVYRNNLFKDCKGELVMRGGSYCEITGNRHENCTGGIRLSGTHHSVTHNLIRNCSNGFRIPYGMMIEQGGLYQAVTECLVAHNTVIDSKKVGLNVGTNRLMDRKEMGVAKFAPYQNRFVNNLFVSDKGTHCIVNEAPENEVANNIFTGSADSAGLPGGNQTIKIDLGDDCRLPEGSPALDRITRIEIADYPNLGADLDKLTDAPIA
jgi:hypothetical protein